MFKSFIFDKDGVLLDTEKAKIRSYYEVLEEAVPDRLHEDQYYDWHRTTLSGKSREDVVNGIIEKYPSSRGAMEKSRQTIQKRWGAGEFHASRYKEVETEIENRLKDYKSIDNFPPEIVLSVMRLIKYAEIPLEEKCLPIKPMTEFLKFLQSKKIPVYLITGSELERTKTELIQVKIDINSFEMVVCKDKTYIKNTESESPKGKQEMYHSIVEHLCTFCKEKPCEDKSKQKIGHPVGDFCPLYAFCAVEDSESGKEAALRAKVPCFTPSREVDEKVASLLRSLCTKSDKKEAESREIVGIDFGGTRTRVLFGDNLWLVLPLSFADKEEKLLEFLKKVCSANVQALGIALASTFVPVKGGKGRRISGHATKFPELSQIGDGLISSIEEYWSDSLKVPVYIVNDAEAAAIAEYEHIKQQFCNADYEHLEHQVCNIMVMTLGTSIGVAFIFNGNPYIGPYTSWASHLILDPEGEWCKGGTHRGCWKTLVGKEALENLAKNMGLIGDWETLLRKIRSGDTKAHLFCEYYAERVARGIAAIVGAVPVECVIIGGGMAEVGPLFFEQVKKRLQRGDLLDSQVGEWLTIVPAHYEEPVAVGARLYAICKPKSI